MACGSVWAVHIVCNHAAVLLHYRFVCGVIYMHACANCKRHVRHHAEGLDMFSPRSCGRVGVWLSVVNDACGLVRDLITILPARYALAREGLVVVQGRLLMS